MTLHRTYLSHTGVADATSYVEENNIAPYETLDNKGQPGGAGADKCISRSGCVASGVTGVSRFGRLVRRVCAVMGAARAASIFSARPLRRGGAARREKFPALTRSTLTLSRP